MSEIRYYRFAGVETAISMSRELFYENEYRLEPFRVETVMEPHVFRYEKTKMLLPPEGDFTATCAGLCIYSGINTEVRYIGSSKDSWETAHTRAEHRGKEHRIQLKEEHFPSRIGVKTVLEAMTTEHLIARNYGFIFHCSYIDYNGKAILFTAPSGTGKSTQAELWKCCRGAEIINGDRAAVRLVDGKLMAEGIPFAGSSEYCKNRSLPIEAIVYLGQAPVTTIRKLRGYEAFSKIWEGVSVNTWDKEDMERVSKVVQRAAAELPVFHMPCTPDESAVLVLEEALRKQVNV